MVRGALSDDHLIHLKMVSGTLIAQKYQDKILESGVLHNWDRNSYLERLYSVNLMMKMCQVVNQQCEGYTKHKPEIADYYEPSPDFLHQILKVYAPIRKF